MYCKHVQIFHSFGFFERFLWSLCDFCDFIVIFWSKFTWFFETIYPSGLLGKIWTLCESEGRWYHCQGENGLTKSKNIEISLRNLEFKPSYYIELQSRVGMSATKTPNSIIRVKPLNLFITRKDRKVIMLQLLLINLTWQRKRSAYCFSKPIEFKALFRITIDALAMKIETRIFRPKIARLSSTGVGRSTNAKQNNNMNFYWTERLMNQFSSRERFYFKRLGQMWSHFIRPEGTTSNK